MCGSIITLTPVQHNTIHIISPYPLLQSLTDSHNKKFKTNHVKIIVTEKTLSKHMKYALNTHYHNNHPQINSIIIIAPQQGHSMHTLYVPKCESSSPITIIIIV